MKECVITLIVERLNYNKKQTKVKVHGIYSWTGECGGSDGWRKVKGEIVGTAMTINISVSASLGAIVPSDPNAKSMEIEYRRIGASPFSARTTIEKVQ